MTAETTQIRAEAAPSTQTTDWYAEGQARSIIIDGQEVTVRYVGRKGRRARICATAPGGAKFVEN